MERGLVLVRTHAFERMVQHHISVADLHVALATGEVIEDYPNDFPYASALLLAMIGSRPIHVVRAVEPGTGTIHVVTVYEADPARWDATFRIRKKAP